MIDPLYRFPTHLTSWIYTLLQNRNVPQVFNAMDQVVRQEKLHQESIEALHASQQAIEDWDMARNKELFEASKATEEKETVLRTKVISILIEDDWPHQFCLFQIISHSAGDL